MNNRRIFKYQIGYGNKITVPIEAVTLAAKYFDGDIYVWVEIDPNETRTEDRTYKVIATGEEFCGAGLTYIDTVIDGAFVWHIYEQ
jgi:hypothetical protein